MSKIKLLDLSRRKSLIDLNVSETTSLNITGADGGLYVIQLALIIDSPGATLSQSFQLP